MAKDKKKEPEQTPETQEQKAEASQPEEAEKKVIAAVYQKGYKLGDRVVRHAMVQVAN